MGMKTMEDSMPAGGQAATRVIGSSAAGWMRPEVLAAISVAFGAVGQLIVKASLLVSNGDLGNSAVSRGLLLRAFIGILFGLTVYAAGTLFWVRAVARASISYLYPISACSYILVAMGGRFLFKEDIQPGRWAGIAVITVGVALLSITNLRGTE